MNDSSDDPLEAAWASLLTVWDQDTRHRGFVHLAASLDRMPEAARRYRALLTDPARAVKAQAGLDEVLKVALASLTPPPRAARPPAGFVLAPVATLAMLIVLTLAVAQVLQRPALRGAPVLGAEILVVALLPWGRMLRRP